MKTGKKGEKNMNKPASIERLQLPIPAKSPKEVKKISKYFKMTSSIKRNKNNGKLYAQML